MAYSVLQTGHSNVRMLYCSVKKKAILKGAEQEMYDFKDFLESAEQAADNKKHFIELRKKYVGLLVSGGHTELEANEFIKKEMPFLYDCESA